MNRFTGKVTVGKKSYDGLELLVRFYYNHGALKQVSQRSGVSVDRLSLWLNGGELQSSDRKALEEITEQGGER